MTNLQVEFDKFFAQFNGKSIEFSDATNKFQCMDGAGKWCDFIGIPYESIRHLHAYQVWTQPTDLTRKYFNLVPNTATNVAQVGDLVIFGQSVGPSGHISVATNKSNSKDYIGFEQNWSGKQFMTTITHTNYNGVLGFLRPKVTGMTPQQKENEIRRIFGLNITSEERLRQTDIVIHG